MVLAKDVQDAIIKYYNRLSSTGYIPDKQIDKLLIFSFIEELLYGPLGQYVTDMDYKDIYSALDCLHGTSCMIPYPTYKKSFTPISNTMPEKYRVTEYNTIRRSECDRYRILS